MIVWEKIVLKFPFCIASANWEFTLITLALMLATEYIPNPHLLYLNAKEGPYIWESILKFTASFPSNILSSRLFPLIKSLKDSLLFEIPAEKLNILASND